MSEIKKGDLVKAWNDNIKSFAVGRLVDFTTIEEEGYLDRKAFQVVSDGCIDVFYSAIKIPPELAKQLEELGR